MHRKKLEVSTERTLEIECGIKKRTKDKRNGIPKGRNVGDKMFSVAECSVGYYTQEGLIPGACIDDRRRKEDDLGKSPSTKTLVTRGPARASPPRRMLERRTT